MAGAAWLLAVPASATEASSTEEVVRAAMSRYHLKALIVRVTSGGNDVYTAALGESMTGVPATPAMHFRNGAMAFSYMATTLMELVDEKKAHSTRKSRATSRACLTRIALRCATSPT